MTLFALLGLVASLGLGCVCERDSENDSKTAGPAMAEMPGMSRGHCHDEPEDARFSSSCCCDAEPYSPAVAEALRATTSLERPAPAADLQNVLAAAAPEGDNAILLFHRRIDRAPPPSFQSPLRI